MFSYCYNCDFINISSFSHLNLAPTVALVDLPMMLRAHSSSQAKVPILVYSYLHLGIKRSECNAIYRMSFKFDDII